jgi:hypothetical protein
MRDAVNGDNLCCATIDVRELLIDTAKVGCDISRVSASILFSAGVHAVVLSMSIKVAITFIGLLITFFIVRVAENLPNIYMIFKIIIKG